MGYFSTVRGVSQGKRIRVGGNVSACGRVGVGEGERVGETGRRVRVSAWGGEPVGVG
jgi:hypothetical protein